MLSILEDNEREIFVSLLSPMGGNCNEMFCSVVEHNDMTEELFEYFYKSDKRKPMKIDGLTLYIFDLIASRDTYGNCTGYGFWFRMRCRHVNMYEG